MYHPDTDPDNVRPEDVLCDFCRRPWADDVPMIEGHQGSCVCGRCLAVASADLAMGGRAAEPADFTCSMCLESGRDRQALDRAGEAGWPSPAYPESVICRRCVDLAARTLHRDPDHDWTLPTSG
jgi:hypothetical protein